MKGQRKVKWHWPLISHWEVKHLDTSGEFNLCCHAVCSDIIIMKILIKNKIKIYESMHYYSQCKCWLRSITPSSVLFEMFKRWNEYRHSKGYRIQDLYSKGYKGKVMDAHAVKMRMEPKVRWFFKWRVRQGILRDQIIRS